MRKCYSRSGRNFCVMMVALGCLAPGFVRAVEKPLQLMSAVAAPTVITGTVIDENGETIIGANILVKGTSQGAVTDIDGNFELSVSALPATLEISYIGFVRQTIKVTSANPVTIVLKSDNLVMDEVVVTGYGTFKKSAFAGSASAVKAEKFRGGKTKCDK